MVDQNTVRTYEVNQVFRFDKNLVTSKESSNPFFFGKTYFTHMCATCSELPSYIITLHSFFFNLTFFSTNYTAYVAGIPKNNIEKEDLSKIAVQDEDISPQQCLLIKLLSMTDQDDVIIDEENYEKKTKGKANNYRTSVNKCLS